MTKQEQIKQEMSNMDINLKEFPIKLRTWCKYSDLIASKCKGLISRYEEPHQISIVYSNRYGNGAARIVARNGGFELQCVNRGLWWQGCSPIYKRASSCLAYFVKHYEDLCIIYK